MASETEDLLTTFSRLTDQLMRSVDATPVEALDWRPGLETNSIWQIATHALAACRHWLIAVVAREPNDRDRPSEFRATAADVAQLHVAADRWLADARRILPAMTTANLDAPCDLTRTIGVSFPRDGYTMSCRAAMLHALEHLGMHTGHVELTLQLWHMDAAGRAP